MAYGEYKDSGRSLGKCLYQLHKIGIPLRIVEDVIIHEDNLLCYQNKPFATFQWVTNDVPIFTFFEAFNLYNKLDQSNQTDIKILVDRLKSKFNK